MNTSAEVFFTILLTAGGIYGAIVSILHTQNKHTTRLDNTEQDLRILKGEQTQ